MKKRFWLAAAALLGLGAYVARRPLLARAFKLPPPKYAVSVQRGFGILMDDGVLLAADHYAPQRAGQFPTILMRTPYGRNGTLLGAIHNFAAQRFAERGYQVIVQDTRGRFDSEGEFVPFKDEARDGRATCDWIARQEWFDGNLGMWGQSYGGYVQWAVAPDAPEYFKAMVPSIAGSQLTPYTGSAFALEAMLRWIANLNQPGNAAQRVIASLIRIFDPSAQDRVVLPAANHLPIGEADAWVTGKPVPYYREWLRDENANQDASYWQAVYFGRQMERVRVPTHFVSGWYDILLWQLLDDYAKLRAAGQTPYLTIGPWKHLDLECAFETLRTGLDWFDANLKNRRRHLRAQSVRVFVMGANEWREFDAFPPPATATRFYLRAQKQLTLEKPDALYAPDHYRYDPADPTPVLSGAIYSARAGAVDNRVLEARADVLTYTTLPLADNCDIIGRVRAELFVRSSLPYADFYARVCDVYPDGRSLNVCDGLVRIQPGIGQVEADGTVRIEIDLWATAQRFARGHCIRLQVSSGAHPRWARNLGTGESLATATTMRVAEQTLYHDAAHPSALILPVMG